MSTDFENVYCGLNPSPGKLRLAVGGVGWKQNEGGDKPVTVGAGDMRYGEWIRCVHLFVCQQSAAPNLCPGTKQSREELPDQAPSQPRRPGLCHL